jgi:hypothetical protein
MTATHPPTFDLNAANGTFTGDLTVDTNTLYVDSTNNRVGVGTTSPSTALDVNGTVTADGLTVDGGANINAANAYLALTETDTTNLNTIIRNNGGQFKIQSATDVLASTERVLLDHATGDISFYDNTGVTQGFYWDADQQSLGLGTTSPSPDYGSDVALEIKGASSPGLVINDTGQASKYGIHADSNDLKITYGTGVLATFQNDGNVGIGTSSPSSSTKLEVYGNSAAAHVGIRANNAAADGYATLWLSNAGDNTGIIRGGASAAAFANQLGILTGSAMPITFSPNNTEAMRIDSSGNLLVGQSTTALPGLGNTTTGISLAGQYDIIAASRTSGASVLVNRNTDDGSLIEFSRNGTTVGDIGVTNSDLYINATDDVFLKAGGNFGLGVFQSGGSLQNITAYTHLYPNGSYNLGASSAQWNNLHLSGGVVFGATGGAVTSKTLDDYEEGTWTATFAGSASTATGNYTKIGNTVYITVYGNSLNVTSSPTAQISGLPFTNSGGYTVASITHDTYSNNSYNGYFGSGATTITMIQDGTISGSAAVVGNPKYIMVSGTYITNS